VVRATGGTAAQASGAVAAGHAAGRNFPTRVSTAVPPQPRALSLKDFFGGPRTLSRRLREWFAAWSAYFQTARAAVLDSLKEQADYWRRRPTARRALLEATEAHLGDLLRQEDYSLIRAYRRLRALADRLALEDPGSKAPAERSPIPAPPAYEEKLAALAARCGPLLRRCPAPGVMLLFAVPLGLAGGASLFYILASEVPSLVNSPLGLLVSVLTSAAAVLGVFGLWFHLRQGAVYRLGLQIRRELAREAAGLARAREDGLRTIQRRELTRQLRLVHDRVEQAREALKRHLRYLEVLSDTTRVADLALASVPDRPGERLLTRYISDEETNEAIYREQVSGGTIVAERAGLLGRPEHDAATVRKLLDSSPPEFYRYLRERVGPLFARVGQQDFFREKYWSRVEDEVAGLWDRMTVFLRPTAPDAGRLYEDTVQAMVAHPSYLRDLPDLPRGPGQDCVGVGLPCFNRVYLLLVRYGIPFRAVAAGESAAGESVAAGNTASANAASGKGGGRR